MRACEHFQDGVCRVASDLAKRDVRPTEQACAYCQDHATPPCAINSVTVSLAAGELSIHDRAAVKPLIEAHGHFLQRGNAPDPTWAQQAWSVSTALADWIGSGAKSVPKEIYRQRLVLCDNCPHRSGHRCGICKCFIRAKAALPNQQCPLPLPLWKAIGDAAQQAPRQKLILSTKLCPGDLLTLTAAIESLHQAYPGEYETDVRTNHPTIWAHNPRITKIADSAAGVRQIEMHYPSINRCNQESIAFLAGYTEHLQSELGRPLRLRVNRPYLYLSPEEAARPLSALWPDAKNLQSLAGSRPIWIVNAGVKHDFTCKQWPVEYFQEIVDRTSHKICWVQIGLAQHDHPQLDNVVSLLDTGPPMRETILLAHRAAGGLGPVTFLQHLMAAWQKPYICLVGGREPATWVQYPHQHTLHTVGSLDCCRDRSCWRARVVPLRDGDKKDKSLCDHPVTEGLQRPVARCMRDIQPLEVLSLLERLAVPPG